MTAMLDALTMAGLALVFFGSWYLEVRARRARDDDHFNRATARYFGSEHE